MKLIGSKHTGFKKQKITEVWRTRYHIDHFPVKMLTMQSIVIVFSRSLKYELEATRIEKSKKRLDSVSYYNTIFYSFLWFQVASFLYIW